MTQIVLALAIGVLTASGVWLMLRPRTFQVIIGLSLVSYAVNLFIFSMGRLRSWPVTIGLCLVCHAAILFMGTMGRLRTGATVYPREDGEDPAPYADPTPQPLVLTAFGISFAVTALFRVVLLASRGLTGSV